MAGSFSDYSEEKVAKWLAGQANAPSVGTRYIGLFSSDPTDANSGTEVTSTVRTDGRIAITFTTPSNGSMSNASEIDFGVAQNDASVTHFGIFDAQTAGNLLFYGPLNSPKTIQSADDVVWDAGALVVTVD